MPAPIYPTQLKLFHELVPKDIHLDCVEDYSHSESRQLIWQGANALIKTSSIYKAENGKLYVGGDFVCLTQNPIEGILFFEYEGKVTRKLKNLWCGDTCSEWMCDTRLMPAKSSSPDLQDLYDFTREEIINEMTDYGTIGLPVTDFKEWLDFTK